MQPHTQTLVVRVGFYLAFCIDPSARTGRFMMLIIAIIITLGNTKDCPTLPTKRHSDHKKPYATLQILAYLMGRIFLLQQLLEFNK